MAKADAPHLRLRIEPALLARLEKAAAKNERTLTGEITHRLGESFQKEDLRQTLETLADSIVAKFGNVKVTQDGVVIVDKKKVPE
jgi:hypothetical protein